MSDATIDFAMLATRTGGDEAFRLGFDIGNRRRVELMNDCRLILTVTAASAERSRREQETDRRDWGGAQRVHADSVV